MVYVDVHHLRSHPFPLKDLLMPKKYVNLPDNQGLRKVKKLVQWDNERNNTNMVWSDSRIIWYYVMYIESINLCNYIFVIWYTVYNYV